MRYIKLFENYNFEKKIGNPKWVLLKKDISDHFMIYDVDKKKPIAYISIWYDDINDVYSVSGAYSMVSGRGIGTFLYESMMTYVYPKGISLSRDGDTSSDALGVWNKLYNREDIKKERIDSNEITHKRDVYQHLHKDNREFMIHVLMLEDTRFFFEGDKSKLDKLLKKGDIYKKKHNISDQDIEYMSWDLE